MRCVNYVAIFCTIIYILFLSSCKVDEKSIEMSAEKEKKIKNLIHFNMNIDEAIEILKTNGFRVGSKHMPTKQKDHYVVFVPLFDKGAKMPLKSTFAEVTGTDSRAKDKAYIIIKADLDNKIISIE